MKILENIKVIELATVLAAPAVCQFLAELGAEVLKIENPNTGGDVTRSWKLGTENPENTVSAYFSSVNWGKTSIPLDISKAENLEILYQFVEKADMIVVNYKAGDAQKLKVSYEDLRKINSKIIYGHITGYGIYNEKVGYDAVIQAETGFVYMNGEPDGKSVKMPVAMIDLLAAHQLKEGLLVAWIDRLQKKLQNIANQNNENISSVDESCYVTVSLFDAAVASLANQATNWLVGNTIPEKLGSEHPNIVPYGNIFATKDSSAILIAVGNDKQFRELCEILQLQAMAIDSRFLHNPDRVKHRIVLNALLAEAFLGFDKNYLLEKFAIAKIPAGAVHTMQEVFALELVKPLLLKANEIVGVRNFVANFYSNEQWHTPLHLTAPPELAK
jgi:crotonobetainyl-CoA:carnitine CoA-transferase CaiB-like acyl-CoA transferase